MLGEAGITVNKNAIPGDPLGPAVTSGIRIGTPAITSRGMKGAEMKRIAEWIADVLQNGRTDPSAIDRTRRQVAALCREHPMPGGAH
jgi:glycine hydroxymethyltransferase